MKSKIKLPIVILAALAAFCIIALPAIAPSVSANSVVDDTNVEMSTRPTTIAPAPETVPELKVEIEVIEPTTTTPTIDENVDPNGEDIMVDKSETTEPIIAPEDETEDVVDDVEVKREESEKNEPTSNDKTEETHEEHEETCNHFWRREYQPETETEDGCIYDSCLYCGAYKLIEVIPAYGED
jgi:hypothetical protein